MRSWLHLALLLIAAMQAGLAQTGPAFQFRFTEPFGPDPVGLKVENQTDPSRPFQASPAAQVPRPLQILIWYPAQTSSAKVMTLGDYAGLVKTETTTTPMEHGKSQDYIAQFTHGLDESPMYAKRDAAPEAGHFPAVIYAPSLNATNTENVELCEYLASQGYVVLAGPSLGVSARSMTSDQDGAEAQAQDIELILSFAKTLPDTDPVQEAVIGYSWGGNAALFASARDKNIRALVGLDPSFLYSGNPVPQAEFAIPLLVFSHGPHSAPLHDSSRQETYSGVLFHWEGDVRQIDMLAMAHLSFSTLYQRSDRFRAEALHFTPADYSLEEGAESYNWLALYTLNFLNAYLKHDSAAQAFLKRTPAENGVPRHLMVADLRPPQARQRPSKLESCRT